MAIGFISLGGFLPSIAFPVPEMQPRSPGTWLTLSMLQSHGRFGINQQHGLLAVVDCGAKRVVGILG